MWLGDQVEDWVLRAAQPPLLLHPGGLCPPHLPKSWQGEGVRLEAEGRHSLLGALGEGGARLLMTVTWARCPR